jgi:hypothetical protein
VILRPERHRFFNKETDHETQEHRRRLGAGVTGVVGGVSQSASAACGVTVTADNDESVEVDVDWGESWVGASTVVPGQRFAAPWARISNHDTDIAAEVNRAFTLHLPWRRRPAVQALGAQWHGHLPGVRERSRPDGFVDSGHDPVHRPLPPN